MRVLRRERKALAAAARGLVHLPLIERLLHPKVRKPVIASILGVAIMVTASLVSVQAGVICGLTGCPHFIIDAVAYFFHGVGAIPLAHYFEVLWLLFMAAE